MSYNPQNPNGQATMANSEPVVLASDQSAVPVSGTVTANIGTVATLATADKQDTGNTSVASIDTKTPALGQALAAASVPVVLTAAQVTTLTPPAAITGFATLAEQQTQTTSLQLIDDTVYSDGAGTVVKGIAILGQDGTNPQAIKTDASGELQVDVLTMPSVAVTNAGTFAVQSTNQANSGVDIGDVTINNAAGASAVNIQDGGNSITVDGTVAVSGTVAVTDNAGSLTVDAPVGTPAFVRLSDGAAAITALPVTDNAGSLTVDYATTGSGTATGALRVELPTNGTGVVGLNAGTNNIGDVDVLTVNGVAPAFGTGVRGATVQRVTIATDDIVPASQSGTWTVQPGNTANTTPWLVQDKPATSGGLSKFHLVSAATTNATNIKASAGQVYAISVQNLNASPRYLKFHNTAGTPTAGSGVTDSFLVPGNTAGAGLVLNIDKGIAFSTGIGITTTTGIADADSAAVAASELLINIYYA